EVEAVVGEVLAGFGGGFGQAGKDPFLRIRCRSDARVAIRASVVARSRRERRSYTLGVHQDEAGGVPQLVAEVLVALGAAEVELDVAAVAGERGDGEAQRVGAEGGDAVGEFLARGPG